MSTHSTNTTSSTFENDRIPIRGEGEDDAGYFVRVLKWSEMARIAVEKHKTWKARHMNGLRELDCNERIRLVLGDLLRSDFLRDDWWDTGIPRADREAAVKELRSLGFDELAETPDADWKFAILLQLKREGTTGIQIDNRFAGCYIHQMYGCLSSGAVESFCSFVTFTRLAYQEIDSMHKATADVCMTSKVHESLTEQQQEYAAYFSEMIDKGPWKEGVEEGVRNVMNQLIHKEEFLKMVEKIRNDRKRITWQKLVGYFNHYELFYVTGAPELNKRFYGEERIVYSNINKGNPESSEKSNDYKELIPLFDRLMKENDLMKYRKTTAGKNPK